MNESVSLKWNNYSSTFLKTLQKFQNKENLCDSTLTCHGKFYPVHRLVLSLCSEYFENIYEKTPCKHPFLIINDIEPIHLEALLNFIYQGEVQVTQENLPKFIKAAEYLKIKGLISDANSRKGNVIFNSYDDFNIYSNKSEFIHVINEDRKRNIRFNNVSHGSKNNLNRAPVILDPHVPIERLTGCVYDSVLSVYNLQKHTKIKEENDFGSVHSKNKNKRPNNCKIAKVKASSKKSKPFRSPGEPMRTSPRKMKPIVNYYIPDTASNDFDNEESITSNNENLTFIEEDLMPQITISSYSGGNGEEFNSIQNSTNHESEESVTVKVELTEYSVEGNGANLDLCGLKSELTTEDDTKLINGFTDLPGSSSGVGIDNEDVYIDDTYSCETFGDLLKNYNKSVSSDTKPLIDDVEEPHKPIVIFPTAKNILARPDNKKLTKKKLFSCKICLYSAFSKLKFQKHMVLNHKSFNSLKKCQYCPYITLERYMICHEKAHSSNNSFKCKFCWYRTIRKKNLMSHQKMHIISASHVGKLKKKYITTKSTKKHELKRKMPKPAYIKQKSCLLQCRYCSYNGKSIANLKAHERTHTGNILKCQYCDYATFFKSALTKHKSIHQSSFHGLGIKKVVYTCHQCPYSSIHRASVLRHCECHALRKPFTCSKCTYSTAAVTHIRRHELLHTISEEVKFPLDSEAT